MPKKEENKKTKSDTNPSKRTTKLDVSGSFCHLHVHTHYSLLDGLGRVDDIMEKVKKLGMNSVAITDHGTMYGVPEFYEKATKAGIKPIIGCEFYVAPNGMDNKRPKIDETRYHLILLARNNDGYKNLMKLASEAHLRGYYYKPRIDLETLKEYSQGLIGMSACVQGEVPRTIVNGDYDEAKEKALEYEKILGKGNFYLEIQDLPNLDIQKKANDGIKKIAQETGLPLVATSDIHYVNPEDAQAQDILLCLQTNRKMEEENRLTMMEHALHLKSQSEMLESFKDVPEALENTMKIAERCNVTIEFGNTVLPRFEVPKKETDNSYLRKLCEEGLKKRYPDQKKITKVHQERLEYELGIISKMGFSSYFLIVQDFMNWSREQGIIVGPGRGSAAGSFVSYLIGITNLDPIEYKLMFERFLNPDRISMPDVDADFADHRRDEVLQYCRQKYGEDRVAQIITFGTMAARAAIRDVGRVLNVEYTYCDKLAKMVPMFTSLQEALDNTQELPAEYNTNASAKKIIDAALKLEGIARHASVHACGVVITDEPVTDYSPLQHMAGKGKTEEKAVVTQYNASSKSSYVEKIGLLKMDFLGLKNLTIIENALKVIKKTTGDIIDIETIPLDDEEAYKLLQRGETTGVFQLESAGMKRYLKKLKPTVFEDIIAMVALYRPGPMEWIPDFIDGKHGRKKVTYLHPNLEPVLKNTYGVAVYQEQVMEIAKAIAGFSGGEADTLRKAMGKKIVEMIQEQKVKFIEGAVKNGLTKQLAEQIFAFIEPFAGYGFNRSHAACYALIGYQTAYLKAHYPAQFMAALLNSDKDDTDRIAIEIEEAREMEIEVLPPAINESFQDFAVITDNTDNSKAELKTSHFSTIQGKAEQQSETYSAVRRASSGSFDEEECKMRSFYKPKIRFGLEAIKGVGENISKKIIAERKLHGPFKDIIDLVERVQDKDLNKKSLEALAMSGALDEIIERNQLMTNVETILSYAKDFQKNSTAGQCSLFSLGGDAAAELPKITFEEAQPATKKQSLSWEKTLLGLYVSDHPLRGYQEYFKSKAIPIHQLNQRQVNQQITVGGIIEKVQKILTRKNQTMFFVTIEDGIGKLEILVFPKTAEKYPDIWQSEKIVLTKGKLSDKDGEFKLLCEEVILVNEEELEKYKNNDETAESFSTTRRNALQCVPTMGSQTVGVQKMEITLFVEESNSNKRKEILQKLVEILNKAPKGSSQIFVTNKKELPRKVAIPCCIKYSEKVLESIKLLLGEENVDIREV